MEKQKRIMLGVKGAFYILFSGVVLFAILGMLVLPSERSTSPEARIEFVSDWYQVLEDGSEIRIDVPGRCEVQKGETAVVETVIPQSVKDGKWLCFRSSQQNMRVYVDGELRHEYNTENSRFFGKTSASTYVFVEIYATDADKVLRVETETLSNYSGIMNTVYYGERYSIWEAFAAQYGAALVIALLMLVFAIVCITFSIVLKYSYNKKVVLEYLSWGILLVAIWIISENRMRQLFFPNISIMASVGFFALMLMPLPFAIYVNSIQQFRYKKGYYALYLLLYTEFIVCTGLQVFDIMDFFETMVVMHSVLILCFVVIILTIIVDIKKGYIHSYGLVAIGIAALIVAGIVEISTLYLNNGQVSGSGLCLGLIFLLAMAAIKTGQDIFGIERDRQSAILDSEMKTSFLAKMSHEIRTPINTIIGMNEMIARETTDTSIEEYVASAQEAGKTLLALVNDVLDFSRMETGNLNLTENVYQLASLISEEVYMVRARAEKKKLEVVVNVDEKLPSYLYGDEVRVKQIVSNLLSNAVKYTDEGRVTFTVGYSYSDAGDFILKFYVADTGVGISEEKMERLFESYSKLEDRANRIVDGTGLGLHIIKDLLDEMQGEIKVRSIHGKGSLFTVTIPQQVIDKTPISVPTNGKAEAQTVVEKYKPSFVAPRVMVLAVDDNEMNLAVVKGFLKQTQIQLDTALSGKQCLELCKEKEYHVILMDHMMPEPDGIQTLQLIRAQQDGCNVNTPVVVLTANALAGSKATYLADGFADYLSKPIVPNKLEEILKQFIPEELLEEEMVVSEETKDIENIATPSPVQEEVVSEEEEIDRQLGLSYCCSDEELYMEMLKTYHMQGNEYSKKLPEYFMEKDWKNYAIIAHAMKSTSLSIGARKFSDMAKEHEMAGKAENGVWIEENWESFYAGLIKVLNAIEEMIKEE